MMYCFNPQCKSNKEMYDFNMKSADAFREKLLKEKKDASEKLTDLSKRLSDMEGLIKEERKAHSKERMSLLQIISDLENELKMKNKDGENIKVYELKLQELSKQNSDFQEVLRLEKEKSEKERVDFEVQKKGFEAKNEQLSDKICEIKWELDLEKAELEKMMKASFQARIVKDDFSVERKTFQQEIQKLTKNLADLSRDIMKEKRVNCDIQKKLDLMTKERNDLSNKVRSFNKSGKYSECPIRPSNLFYDISVDKTSKSYADLPTYKRVNMQWRIKGTFSKSKLPKSSVSNKNTFAFKNENSNKSLRYSIKQMFQIANDGLWNSSSCHSDGCDYSSKSELYFNSFYHSHDWKKKCANKKGPKSIWVPKSV